MLLSVPRPRGDLVRKATRFLTMLLADDLPKQVSRARHLDKICPLYRPSSAVSGSRFRNVNKAVPVDSRADGRNCDESGGG